MRGVRYESHRARALYIAHAGVQKAARALLDDPEYRGVVNEVPVAGGAFSYVVQGSETFPELDDRYRIVSTGTDWESAPEPVSVRLTVIVVPSRGRSVLDYPLAAGDTIRSRDSAVVGSPIDNDYVIYAGRDDGYQPKTAWFEGVSNTLYGTVDLASTESQSYPPNGDDSLINYGVDPVDFPTFDIDALRDKAIANGTYYTGLTVFEDVTLDGVIFVEDGSLLIEGTVIVNGCLVHKPLPDTYSNLEVQDNANLTIRPDNDPDTGVPNVAIIKLGDASNSNIAFEDGSTSDIEGYVFSEGNVEFEYGSTGDLTLRGAIIAEGDLLLRSDSQIHVTMLDDTLLAEEVFLMAEPILVTVAWIEE